jgi:hypothetical protein
MELPIQGRIRTSVASRFLSFLFLFHSTVLAGLAHGNGSTAASTRSPTLVSCARNFAEIHANGQLDDLKTEFAKSRALLDPKVIETYSNLYSHLESGTSSAAQFFPEATVLRLVLDEERSIFAERLGELLRLLPHNSFGPSEVETALKQFVPGRYASNESLQARISAWQADPGLAQNVRRLLGENSVNEAGLILHGGDPLNPSNNSLIGRYLRDTGASSMVRTFTQANPNGNASPQRLVVAISPASFPKFKELFSERNFLFHTHGPGQGTLYIAHNGKAGSYANLSSDVREGTSGSVWPLLLMSTNEGERMEQYARLGRINGQMAKTPWILKDGQNSYCKIGGYNSCTHWIGEIPIGERTVPTYTFPGNRRDDPYSGGTSLASDATADAAPRTSPLTPYQVPRDTSSSDVQHEQLERLASRVWKPGAGNELLADAIGMKREHLEGEFANPGWVLNSFTAGASQERVPVVFYWVDNHQQPIAPNFPLQNSLR